MLYLVRHGNTIRQENMRILSEEGNQQARILARRIRLSTFDLVIHSSSTRAKQTWRHLMRTIKAEHVIEDAQFKEIYQTIVGGPHDKGTPIAKMRADLQRIERAWLHAKRLAAEQNVIVVCHANVIRYFISRFARLPPKQMWRIEIPEASVVILNDQSGKVEFYNYASL